MRHRKGGNIKNLIVNDWIVYLESIKEHSSNTVISYERDIIGFLQYLLYRNKLSNLDIDKISTIDIKDIDESFISSINVRDIIAFINYNDKNLNNTASTRYRKISSLKSFFNYLYKIIGLIDSNPVSLIDTPKIPKRLPHYLELQEVKKLLESILNADDEYYRTRDYAIVMLFLNTGLRLSELVNIKTEHIEKKDQIRIIGKGNKERVIYLNSSVIEVLMDYLNIRPNSDSDFLFLNKFGTKELGPRGIQYLVSKYLKESGLDGKYSPHTLRHTAATLLYQYGNVDIRALQMILGHESISTTQIYTHVSEKQLQDAVELNPIKDLDLKKS